MLAANQSLRKQTLNSIESEYPLLVQKQPVWKSMWSIYVEKYKVTILVTVLLFYSVIVTAVPPGLVTYKTASILIDQRISNYVTMTSMTLAIFGFLLSNLIKKDSFNYELLYKKSGFLPIIYFVFIGIGSFMVISTSRDVIEIRKINYAYGNLIISSTVLMLAGLCLIFSLFQKILYFTNEEKIMSYVEDDILIHLRRELLDITIKTKSQKTLSEFLESRDIDGYYGIRMPQGSHMIHDIDLYKLAQLISLKPNLRIPANLFVNSENVSANAKNSENSFIQDISEVCVYTKNIVDTGEFTSYLNHIGRELDKSISESNSVNLIRVYRVFDKMLDQAAVFHSPVYLRYVEFVYVRTNKSINKIIDKGNFDLLKTMYQQIELLLTTCARRGNSSYFAWICDSLSWPYPYTSDRFEKGDISARTLESIFSATLETFERVLTYNLSFQSPSKKYIKIYESIFVSICGSIRRSISNKNKDHLIRLINFVNGITNIDQIESQKEIRDQLRLSRLKIADMADKDREIFLKESIVMPTVGYYQRHTKVITKHWIFWMHQNSLLTKEEMDSFLEVIGDQTLWLDDLTKFTQNIGYFERRNWYFGDITKRKDSI